MIIKTNDGSFNVASKAETDTALGFGIGTLVLQLLRGGALGGLFGNAASCGDCGVATKTDLAYVQELGKKDSEIALLKSEQNTEIKIADVYDRLVTKINQNQRDQDAWNAAQMVNNSQMSAAIATNQSSIAQLQNCCGQITKLIVPASAVCPEPMSRYNSWTAPTNTPTSGA